ncbi:MAG: DUF4012 domain-containing protein [Patescibacteria group bacterium]
MTKILIFLIGLLIPATKPCLSLVTPWHRDTAVSCLQSLPALEPKLKFVNFFLRRDEFTAALKLIDETKSFLPEADYFLGTEKPTTYLILLQNNHEMRANGGFFGSYAVVTIDKGQPTFRFQDIYVPDGALVGHVEPPPPIQTSFQQGWFKLRDSDWEPDWPTTAKTIRWFFAKGNEINPDLLLTLNLTTIEKIMHLIGEVDIPEYGFKLTADNLYSLLQNEAEIDFFPGSTQKKDALTAVGAALTKKLSSLKLDQSVQLVKILLDQLNHGNLLLNSTNANFQTILEQKDWAGKLTVPACQVAGCLNDTVLLIEANMGANKANCCVERKSVHTITKSETDISHLINLTFTNNSPLENPLPPRFFGGNYISYLRYYLPENAKNIRLTAQPTLPKTLTQYPTPFDGIKQKLFDLKFNYSLREVGFFHTTAAGSQSAVQLSYDLPLDGNPASYQLNLLKQHGQEKSPQEINLFGKSSSTDLTNDLSISTPLSL